MTKRRKDVYVNSFFPGTVRLWNSLPKECFFFTHNLGVIHVLHFQIKNIFSNKKKNNHVQFETHFCKEALKV